MQETIKVAVLPDMDFHDICHKILIISNKNPLQCNAMQRSVLTIVILVVNRNNLHCNLRGISVKSNDQIDLKRNNH